MYGVAETRSTLDCTRHIHINLTTVALEQVVESKNPKC